MPLTMSDPNVRLTPQQAEDAAQFGDTLGGLWRTWRYRASDERASKRLGIKPLSEIRKDRPVWEAAWNPDLRMSGSDITGDPYTGFFQEVFGDPANLVFGMGALKAMKVKALAKARNLKSQKLLATGGMPEEVFEKTLVKEPVYHGGPEAWEGLHFDPSKANPDNLYVPGRGGFWTDAPELASGYARSSPDPRIAAVLGEKPAVPSPAAVQKRLIDVRNPLDVEKTYTGKELVQTVRPMEPKVRRDLRWELIQELMREFPDRPTRWPAARSTGPLPKKWSGRAATGEQLYEAASRGGYRKAAPFSSRELAVEDEIARLGFDSLMYPGGVRAGGGQKSHQAYILFRPEQAYAPWVAPRPVPVPPGAPPWLGGAAAYQARPRRE